MQTNTSLSFERTVEHEHGDALREWAVAEQAAQEVIDYAATRGYQVHFGRSHQHAQRRFDDIDPSIGQAVNQMAKRPMTSTPDAEQERGP